MGIWAGIIAIFKTLGEAISLSRYWLNPKERKRRRKKEYLIKYKELQSERDKLFKEGAEKGFTIEIDIRIANVEKQIMDLKKLIKALE